MHKNTFRTFAASIEIRNGMRLLCALAVDLVKTRVLRRQWQRKAYKAISVPSTNRGPAPDISLSTRSTLISSCRLEESHHSMETPTGQLRYQLAVLHLRDV